MNKLWWLLPTVLCLAGAGFLILKMFPDQGPGAAAPATAVNRVVSLAPNLTEILFALGVGEKVVAVSSDSDYPPEAASKNKVGTFWQPNTEAIIASKPDLVITECFEQQRSVAEALRHLGYRVLTLKVETIEELLAAIKNIGDATGTQDHAEKLVEDIVDRLDNLRSRLAGTNKVKVLWVVQTEPLRVAGRNTFLNELLELVGGENAIGPTIQQYPPLSTEELLASAADIIIQSAMTTDNIRAEQHAAERFWSKWPVLPAVRNNRIYVIDPDTTLRLGPRLWQGLELVAHCLHPDVDRNQPETAAGIK